MQHEIDDGIQLAPVALWLHPFPPASDITFCSIQPESSAADQPENARELKEKRRRRGEKTDDIDGKDGLLAFRLESLLSWAEFVPVDRTADDDDEDHAEEVANDLDVISIARSHDRPAARLKFDLDLPSEEYDDIVLQAGIHLPEWDYRKAQLKTNHCNLVMMQPSVVDASDCQHICANRRVR